MATIRLLFVSCCCFLTVGSSPASVSPPQNVSMVWIDEFFAKLSWAPPQHSMEKCQYTVDRKTVSSDNDRNVTHQYWLKKSVMDGGFLQMSVKTLCGGNYSGPVVLNFTYPALVRDLQCYVYAATKSHCSWSPASEAPDLRFFYRLNDGDSDQPVSSNIRECPSYNHTGANRTGCNLEADVNQNVYIFFNATLMDTVARNSFLKRPSDDVRPPSIKWSVKKTGNKFAITWTEPVVEQQWSFVMKYTECKETKEVTFPGQDSGVLDLVPHCPYCMAIKAQNDNGKTPWTEEKCFDADIDANAWKWAAIIIPLILAGVAAMMFVCYRKNKEYIFPNVPQPRDLLSDISDNNNKSTVADLYVATEEEENCKVTLVLDSLINPLDF